MIKKLINWLFWKFYEADIKAEDFDNEEIEAVFLEIAMNDKFPELLKAMLKGDKTRHFRASDDKTRNIIKGEYLRTLFFYKKVKPTNIKITKDKSKGSPKFGGRYGN